MAIRTFTALDFIKGALRLLRVIDPIEDPSPEDADTCFDALNDWLDGLQTQRATIYKVARHVYPLTNGTSTYSIGDGGAFNQPWPLWIDAWSVVPNRNLNPPGLEMPMGPILNIDQYQGITLKSQTAPWPNKLFYNHNYTAGLGGCVFHPVPNTSLCDAVLYTPEGLTLFADLATPYSFAPGFARAIKFNLALEVQDEYQKQLSERAVEIAKTSMAWIKRGNFRPTIAKFDAALVGRGRYNIYTDG